MGCLVLLILVPNQGQGWICSDWGILCRRHLKLPLSFDLKQLYIWGEFNPWELTRRVSRIVLYVYVGINMATGSLGHGWSLHGTRPHGILQTLKPTRHLLSPSFCTRSWRASPSSSPTPSATEAAVSSWPHRKHSPLPRLHEEPEHLMTGCQAVGLWELGGDPGDLPAHRLS